MKTWLLYFVMAVLCGCDLPEAPPARTNPDVNAVRTAMGQLRKNMSRQEAEALLGLRHSRTNSGMIWKYSLATNQSICLWFHSPCDPKTGLPETNRTMLVSATLDFQSVTSRISELWMGMSVNELEATLGIREPMSYSGTSSGVFLDYMFDDPENPQNDFPAHELTARFSTPRRPFFSTNEVAEAMWLRTNGFLLWVSLDGKTFIPLKREKP